MSEQLFRTLPNFPPVCGAFFSFASRSTFQYSFSFKMALCFSAASAFLFPNYHHFRVLVTSLLQVWRQQRVRYPKSLHNDRLFCIEHPSSHSYSAFLTSIPYTISAIISPFLGFAVDKTGRWMSWVAASCLCMACECPQRDVLLMIILVGKKLGLFQSLSPSPSPSPSVSLSNHITTSPFHSSPQARTLYLPSPAPCLPLSSCVASECRIPSALRRCGPRCPL